LARYRELNYSAFWNIPLKVHAKKIAAHLDSTLTSETDASSSTLWKSDLVDFDIGEFV